MIINVQVDLTEYYDSEDQSIAEAIKSSIAYDVKQAVINHMKSSINTEITQVVKEEVENEYKVQISKLIKKELKDVKLKGRYSNDPELSLSDWIKSRLEESSGWQSIPDMIKKRSEVFVKETKDRYDLLFASQIVSNLHKNDMLKEDIGKMLLEKKD